MDLIWNDDPVNTTAPVRMAPQPQRKTLLRTAAQTMEDAAKLPPLQPLISGIWNVGGFGILAGDTGAGKSLFATSEAFRIAQTRPIIYYDFELSDRQFQSRYENTHIPENFIYAKYDPQTIDFAFSFEDVKADLSTTGAATVVIDNVSALHLKNTVDPDAALSICRGLKQLQISDKISVLVLAHVPKIAPGTPLNINHLAGSKALANFADNVTFIGKSTQGADIRYIKTVKNRDGELPSVFAISISNPGGGRLGWTYLGLCDESEHLQENLRDVLKDDVMSKRNEGKSLRDIQKEIYFDKGEKLSHMTIKRWAETPVNGNAAPY